MSVAFSRAVACSVVVASLASASATNAQGFGEGDGSAAAIPAPPDRASDAILPIALALDVNSDESELTFSFATKPKILRRSDANAQTLKRTSFGLDVSLPLGGKDDLTDSATLNGLSNGAAITGKFVPFSAAASDNFDSKAFLAMHERARQNCRAEAETVEEKTVCEQQPRRDFTVLWRGAPEASVSRALLEPSWSLVLTGSIGWNDFKFIESATLADGSTNKLQYAFGATTTLYPADAMSSYSLGAEYQRSFKAQDETIVCKPTVVNPTDDCKFGSSGRPELDRSLVIRAEARAVLPLGSKLGELALAPIGSIDALDGDFGLELPLYWIPAGEWPISPGVKVGYSSEDEKVAFGVFLKTGFSF